MLFSDAFRLKKITHRQKLIIEFYLGESLTRPTGRDGTGRDGLIQSKIIYILHLFSTIYNTIFFIIMEYINCGWCGTTIRKKNSLHKFCSSTCKKKSWRKENSKPEFPTFISKPVETKRHTIPINRESVLPSTPSVEIDRGIEQIKKPVRRVRRIVTASPATEEKEPVTSKNPLRDAKEKRVMDTLMQAFDKMLENKRKIELQLGVDSKKEIEKKIAKLESKRKKIVKQANKLNMAIRKKVKRISKQINKGVISNDRGQREIDKIRDREVRKLVEVIKNRDWILIYDEDYYFP